MVRLIFVGLKIKPGSLHCASRRVRSEANAGEKAATHIDLDDTYLSLAVKGTFAECERKFLHPDYITRKFVDREAEK